MTFRWRCARAAFIIVLMIGPLTLATSAQHKDSAQHKEMLDQILELNGHLLIQPIDSPFTDWMQVADRVAKVEGVGLVVPVIEGQALVSSPPNASGVVIRGVRAAELSKMPLIIDHLREGTVDVFDESQGVAIGGMLADRLLLRAGDSVTLIAPRGRPSTAPQMKQFRVVAVFTLGASKCDGIFVFMPLTEAQSYFNHPGDVTGIEVHVTEADKVAALRQRVTEAAGRPIIITDWRQRNATCLDTR
jgi:lipoprotein-releasing system permease protein